MHILFFLIQFPPVQDFITSRAETFLSNKLNTTVEIGGVNLALPNYLLIENVRILDTQKDTLWVSKEIRANVFSEALLRSSVMINDLILTDVIANVYTLPNGKLNYQPLLEALSDTTTTTQKDTTAGSKWDFALRNILLKNIDLHYQDGNKKLLLDAKLENLRANIPEMDLASTSFYVDYLDIQKADVYFLQGGLPPILATEEIPKPKENDSTDTALPDISFKEIGLQQVSVSYIDSTTQQSIKADVEDFSVIAQEIDLNEKKLLFNRLRLFDSEVAYASWAKVDTTETQSVTSTREPFTLPNWVFRLYEVEMEGNRFAYNQYALPKQAKGIDYNHLLIEKQSLIADNLFYTDSLIRGNIKQLSLVEQSGFRIRRARLALEANTDRLTLRNLLIETGNSTLNEYVAIAYPSFDAFVNDIEALDFTISLNRIRVGLQDALYFVPNLVPEDLVEASKMLSPTLDLQAKGSLRDLTIQKGRLAFLGESYVFLTGTAQNLLGNFALNLTLDTLNLLKQEMQPVLNKTPYGTTFTFPQETGIKGSFEGTLQDFTASLAMRSTGGNIALLATQNTDSTGVENFNTRFITSRLALGQLLNQSETLGSLTSSLAIQGTGLVEGNPTGTIEGRIDEITLLEYPYQDVSIEGAFSLEGFEGSLDIADPNINADYNGTVRYAEKALFTNFRLNINEANLNALGVVKPSGHDYQVNGNITSTIELSAEGFINGKIRIDSVIIGKDEEEYILSKFDASVEERDDLLSANVASDWFSLSAEANAPSRQLIEELPYFIEYYYQLSPDSVLQLDTLQSQLALEGKLKETSFITEVLYPDLQWLSKGKFALDLDHAAHTLKGTVAFDSIRYADAGFSDLLVDLSANPEEFTYSVGLSEVALENFKVINPTISGYAKNDTLYTRLNLNDSLGYQQFLIGASLTRRDSLLAFRFNPDEFILNYELWEVPDDNQLIYNKQNIRSNNLRFVENGGKQSFQVDFIGEDSTQTNIQAKFSNFQLEFLTKAIQSDDKLIGGTVDGSAQLNNINTDTLSVLSNLAVKDLSLLGDTLGNLTLEANNYKNTEVYDVLISLKGNNNDIIVTGEYRVVSAKNPISLAVDINTFDVSTLDNLTFGQASNLTGFLEGRVVFKGNLDQPIVRGSIYIPKVSFKLNYLNTQFSLADERIRFSPRGIEFSEFLLKDAKQRTALIDGSLLTTNYVDYRFDLDVTTDRFQVLNTNANDNELFYGKVFTSSTMKITGTPTLPDIKMTSKILEGTAITFNLPDDNLETVNREGIVEFVDVDSDSTFIILEQDEDKTSEFEGVEIDANIEIDDNAQLAIIIDPQAGDKLTVQGGGNLSFTMDQAGTMTLTGIYSLKDGEYLLTFYDLVKRRFKIKPGSRLIWNGDPYNATLDITALYETNASPMELLPPTDDSDEMRARRQKLPFIVELTMRNQLENPEVTFDIELAERVQNQQVNTQLQLLNQNEAELNKQVFALLILNSFVSSNPLEGGGQNNVFTSTARSSVSRVLTQQLNRLSGKYLKGFDLNFELNSFDDYTNNSLEGRTELGVELSKELFNDRVEVNVGGNVNLTGDGQDVQARNSQQIAGNISIEYRLTEDGRYKIRAFRRNAFERFIDDGDFVETGVSFIFIRQYDKLKELFNAKKSKEKQDSKKSPARKAETPEIEEEKN